MLLCGSLNSNAVRCGVVSQRYTCLYNSQRPGSFASLSSSRFPTLVTPRSCSLRTPRASSEANEQQPIQRFEWRWEESEDALRAYGWLFFCLLGGSLLPLTGLRYADLGYFTGLAICTIYIGAHRGLSSKLRTTITFKQGLLAPVACSVALFGGYIVVKFFPDLSLSTIFNAYFWLLGSLAVSGALAPLARQLGGAQLGTPSVRVDVPNGWLLDDKGESLREVSFAPTDIVVVLLGIAIATIDLQASHTNYTVNNILACLICSDILQLIGLRSFRVAAVMLLGLLVYDVFWVFGSPAVFEDNVMLSVATSDVITGPMRLLYPRATTETEAGFFPFSLLGLGDLAVPGLLACLALRFDASRATDMRSRGMAAAEAISASLEGAQPGMTNRQLADAAADAADRAFDRVADLESEQRRRTEETWTDDAPSNNSLQQTVFAPTDAVLYQRTYFTPVMFAYVLGLGAAFTANAVTKLGQPALLYLVPCTLLAVLFTAANRDELRKIAAFTDTTGADAIIQSKLQKSDE